MPVHHRNQIAKEHGIVLVEDCSHAHGAKYNNKLCGTYGTAAAWSLQGQKIITGGEGGIMLTDDSEVYYRALLQGHYNKRAYQAIPKDHELHDFALTGLGLKFRSHPLAVALAEQQFNHLEDWAKIKNIYAEQYMDVLSQYDFVIPPNISNRMPSWYGFVFQVDENRFPGGSSFIFDSMKKDGCVDADLPTSTCPIYNLPLFTRTQEVMPRLYSSPCYDSNESFPGSDRFFRQAVKLPVWVRGDDRKMVNKYKDALNASLIKLRNSQQPVRNLTL